MGEQTQKKHNYYVGIDLGTTNSAISWGRMDSRGQLQVSVMEVNMMGEGNSFIQKELLPSYVYFKEGSPPIVGEYARYLYGRHSQRIIKSVKSHMGRPDVFQFDGKAYGPVEVSAFILKHLAHGAKAFLGHFPEDVVIAIPASFDTDMRQATLEAARLAGFRLEEDDGSPRNILVHEPVAALHDFINRQDRGEVPESLIDFHQPRLVLVYDLGGGTLDVSLHQVALGDGGRVKVEDYAISRYTRLGGDNFDRAVAQVFLDAYRSRLGDLSLTQDQQAELEAKFQYYAENAKQELSSQVNNRKMLGMQRGEDRDIQAKVLQVPFDNKPFEYTLSLEEYREIVKPLLGEGLTLSNLDDLDDQAFFPGDNMVYPVLDVLKKAEEKLGRRPQVDAVLLNGGMTRFCLIPERLEALFGFPPLSAGDPDKAVARGAAAYHYDLHQGHKVETILNDSIGLEIEGGAVEQLVPAGTVLPYRSGVYRQFIIPRGGVTYLDLPFYLGRGKTTAPPNRRIASRRVRTSQPFQQGEVINIQVQVNQMGLMTLKGWSPSDPQKKIEVEISTAGSGEAPGDDRDYPAGTPGPGGNGGGGHPTGPGFPGAGQPRPSTPAGRHAPARGPEIDVKSSVDFYVKTIKKYNREPRVEQKAAFMRTIKEQEKKILLASNGEGAVEPLLELIDRQDKATKSRMIILLGNLGEKHPTAAPGVCRKAREITDPALLSYNRDTEINTLWRYCVEAIGKAGLASAEGHLLELARKPDTIFILPSLIISLGKTGGSLETLEFIVSKLKAPELATQIESHWAVGKLGSRERENPLAIRHLTRAINIMAGNLDKYKHESVLAKAIYALGEICDRRFPDRDTVSEEKGKEVTRGLERLLMQGGRRVNGLHEKFAGLAISMIQGTTLTREQEKILLATRSNLALGQAPLGETG